MSRFSINVLLLYPHEIHTAAEIQRVSSFLTDLNLRYQVLISVLLAPLHQYQNSQEGFWENVRREGIASERI